MGWLRASEVPLDFGGEGGLKLSFSCAGCLCVELMFVGGRPVCVLHALVREGRQ